MIWKAECKKSQIFIQKIVSVFDDVLISFVFNMPTFLK